MTIVGLLLGAYVGRKTKKGILLYGTSFGGAFLVIRGASTYIGNFPSEFSPQDIEGMKDIEATKYIWGYLAGWIILGTSGACVQVKKCPDNDDDF